MPRDIDLMKTTTLAEGETTSVTEYARKWRVKARGGEQR